MPSDPIVIVGASRTPMGGLQGDFKSVSAPQLGAAAIEASLKNCGIAPETIDEVLMGCVLSAGLGQAPARQAALAAGLPRSTPCTTINKMCGSGMRTAMMAHDMILAGSAQVVVAGGMESMSNAPYLLDRARAGYRMGHGRVLDHMFLDGLEDAYDRGRLMGTFAEDCAQTFGFARAQQDDFAISSLRRAQTAQKEGHFANEIAPVTVTEGRETRVITADEQPPKARIDKIASLKPAFREGGTVTAANSSSISDGAAALVLMRRSQAEKLGLKPRAVVIGHASYAGAPGLFPVAPVFAARNLIARIGWKPETIDLYEVNEAFAVVAMAAMRELAIPHEKINVHGGACALGHPIGASGARILVTLLNALETHGLNRGLASICIGGGEATAMAIERVR